MGLKDAIHRKEKSKEESKRDYYQSPYVLTEVLCQHLLLSNSKILTGKESVLDPCSGGGAMTKVLQHHFAHVTAFDKYMGETKQDFLEYNVPHNVICFNPPYSQKNEFLDHALELADDVFILLPLNVDNYTLFNANYKCGDHYAGKIVIYPKLFMEDTLQANGKAKVGGTTVYSFYHFTNDTVPAEKYEYLYDLRKYYNDVKKYLT